MANEDCIVNVDGISSSDSDMSSREDEEIDVEADEGLELSGFESGTDQTDEGEAGAGASGGGSGHKARKGHHNELEKQRRGTINQSYKVLKRLVRRLNPTFKPNGRDRCLELATRLLRSKAQQVRTLKMESKELVQTLKEALPMADEKKKKEIEKQIRMLTRVDQQSDYLHLPPPSGPVDTSSEVSDEDGENAGACGTLGGNAEASTTTSDEESLVSDDEAASDDSIQSGLKADNEDDPTPVSSP